MKNLILAIIPLFALTLSGCIIVSDDGDSSLTIENESTYDIYEVYLTEVGSRDWGPDLLRGTLRPGDYLVIDYIECGNYDALVVDDTDLPCELRNFRLCFDDAVWVITDRTLDACYRGSATAAPASDKE